MTLVRRIPRAAWICGLAACLNAVCWSIVTPAFQVVDEPSHFAYVKQLAETGHLPSSSAQEAGAEEGAALRALHQDAVRLRPQNQTIATQAEQETLDHELAATPHETGSPDAGVAASQPPLYYALEAIPYSLASSGTVLDQLQLMRLVSALFAALTAIFAFLFTRETLPGAPWAWTVGGLSVAVAPLLGFMSGAVNPDSLLFAVSAATFYCLARAFRRGLDTCGAVAIGAVTAIGLVTKLNFIGLVPGILLGLVILSVRARRSCGRSAWRPLALAIVIGFSPVIVYVVIDALSGDALLGQVSRRASSIQSVPAEINYIWQLYLPRLPGTVNDFPGLFTTRQLWFDGYVGLYGWLDTTFPSWVYSVALIPAAAIALLCGRALVGARGALRSRAGELHGVRDRCHRPDGARGRCLLHRLPGSQCRICPGSLPAADAGAVRSGARPGRARRGTAVGADRRHADRRAVPGPQHLEPDARRRAFLRLDDPLSDGSHR